MTLVAISLYVLRQLLIGNTKAAMIFYSDYEMSLSTKGKAQNFRKILCLKKKIVHKVGISTYLSKQDSNF